MIIAKCVNINTRDWNVIPTYSRPTASGDIYRCPICGEEFLMNYQAPYCDHCSAEFEPMENPRGDWYD